MKLCLLEYKRDQFAFATFVCWISILILVAKALLFAFCSEFVFDIRLLIVMQTYACLLMKSIAEVNKERHCCAAFYLDM